MPKSFSNKEFIDRAVALYGDSYEFEDNCYVNMNSKVTFTCKQHGRKTQWANHLLRGVGCPDCSSSRINYEDFVKRAIEVHEGKYSYPKEMKQSKAGIQIICKVHGEFFQRANHHVKGAGCNSCHKERGLISLDDFEQLLSTLTHGEFSLVTKDFPRKGNSIVIAKCSRHGEISKTVKHWLDKTGCRHCYYESKKLTLSELKRRAFEAWRGLYQYDWSKSLDGSGFIYPICSHHGVFKVRSDLHFLGGGGCPDCSQRSYGEVLIKKALDELGETYIREWTGHGIRSQKGRLLLYDFYLPSRKILIEFDGVQHKRPEKFGRKISDEEALSLFNRQRYHDTLKNNWAKKNDLFLFRIERSTLNDFLNDLFQWLENPDEFLTLEEISH